MSNLQIEGSREGFEPQLLQTLLLNPAQLRKKGTLFDTANDFAGYFPMIFHVNPLNSHWCDRSAKDINILNEFH